MISMDLRVEESSQEFWNTLKDLWDKSSLVQAEISKEGEDEVLFLK